MLAPTTAGSYEARLYSDGGYTILVKSAPFLVANANANENDWLGGTNRDWFTPSNWSLKTVPTSNHRVTISRTPGPVVAGYGKWAVCKDLVVGLTNIGMLAIEDGANISISNTTRVGSDGVFGRVTMAGGTFFCKGQLTVGHVTTAIVPAYSEFIVQYGRLVSDADISIGSGKVDVINYGSCIVSPNIKPWRTNARINLRDGRILLSQSTAEQLIHTGKLIAGNVNSRLLHDTESQNGFKTIYSTDKQESSPLVYNNMHNITISGKMFGGISGYAIELNNCTGVTITNCEFQGVGRGGADATLKVAIRVNGGSNIQVKNNRFRDCAGGVHMWNASGPLSISSNWVLNLVRYRASNDDNTLENLTTSPQIDYAGNGFQLIKCNGGGMRINNNIIDNLPYQYSGQESDKINIYKSNGTASDPIQVSNNRVRCWDGARFIGYGAGIVLTDAGGSYQVAKNNIVVNGGLNGITPGGGGSHTLTEGNKVFGDRDTLVFSWSGINYSDYSSTGQSAHHILKDNMINWTDYYGNAGDIKIDNPAWHLNLQQTGNSVQPASRSSVGWGILPTVLFPNP
jgi:hypothetical protein